MGFFGRSKKSRKNKEQESNNGRNTEEEEEKAVAERGNTCSHCGRGGGEENYYPQELKAAGDMSKLYPGLTSVEVTYSKNVKFNFEPCCEVCGCRCPCHGRPYNNWEMPCPCRPCITNNNNSEMPPRVTAGHYGEDDNMYVEAPPPTRQQLQWDNHQATGNHHQQYYYGPPPPPPQRSSSSSSVGGNELALQRGVPSFESAFSDENVEACTIM